VRVARFRIVLIPSRDITSRRIINAKNTRIKDGGMPLMVTAFIKIEKYTIYGSLSMP
jgi:hypothetical protein